MISLVPAALAVALSGPAFLAVCSASEARPFAPLAPAAYWCAAAAALFTALCITAQLLVIGGGGVNAVLLAPPVVGVAPWAAGELCRGPSRRQDESFAAALVAAYAGALLAQWACAHLLLTALASAAGATVAYLAVRGEA